MVTRKKKVTRTSVCLSWDLFYLGWSLPLIGWILWSLPREYLSATIPSCWTNVTINGTEFKLCTNSVPREAAQSTCASINMTLAVIYSQYVFDYWHKLLAYNFSKNEIWVGATFKLNVSAFVWDTGGSVPQSFMTSGTNLSSCCVSGMCLRFYTNQYLQQLNCSDSRGFLCQEVTKTSALTTAALQETTTWAELTAESFRDATTQGSTLSSSVPTGTAVKTEPQTTSLLTDSITRTNTSATEMTPLLNGATTEATTILESAAILTETSSDGSPSETTATSLRQGEQSTTTVPTIPGSIATTIPSTTIWTVTSSAGNVSTTTAAVSDCICGCHVIDIPNNKTLRDALVAEETEKIKEHLLLHIETLSSYIRKKMSIMDNRPSAKFVGGVGIVVMVTSFLLIVLMDTTHIFQCSQRQCQKSTKSSSKGNTPDSTPSN
ncbi:mucin-5AC [Biomphalaria pfeifferi]|uniref:Mucin-5AC n=1 Tax=Biomphalaria pfeifferi TaxID=112525 RepID=A0AAD8F426_BIOPF|nr:mucin-5AC [Biomphalaria pfeifferi]